MATAHIEANKKDIAKIVLMPGDPLRAKLFAEIYLKEYKQINSVRGMLGFTGIYKGIEITVMGHGMGLDSIGIYSYELYTEYDVDTIIRFGSCGSYNNDINIFDIIIADKAYSKSNYGEGFGVNKNIVSASESLIKTANKIKENFKIEKKIINTTVNSSMWFYKTHNIDVPKEFVAKGVDVVEMEAYALYAIAKSLNKNALTLLTVSDHLVKKEFTTSEERRTGFKDMFNFMLKIVEEINK